MYNTIHRYGIVHVYDRVNSKILIYSAHEILRYFSQQVIGRNQKVWTDAEKFYPERFVGSDIDLHGCNFQLIPFGSGNRGCPGMQLGFTIVQLVVAQLVHCFDWELSNDMMATDMNMTKDFGIVCHKAKHLLAIPPRRLKF
ncbi:hypothetical protein CRYUN_Cryun17cG0086700 [Craigia yunnanensis]